VHSEADSHTVRTAAGDAPQHCLFGRRQPRAAATRTGRCHRSANIVDAWSVCP